MGPERTYAIGDIHGHLDKLRNVHKWIAADRAGFGGNVEIVHVGDLTDRGPDSAGVINWLVSGLAAGEPWVVLKGNHDRMMSLFLDSPSRRDDRLRPDLEWLDPRLGGRTTLASYGVNSGDDQDRSDIYAAAIDAVPMEHRAFLAGLPVMHRTGSVAFVHAGVRPGVTLDKQVEDDLVWIRSPFLEDTRDHEALIIHGHSPVEEVTHYGNRVNIDTGAGYGKDLSVVIIEQNTIWQLGSGGRVRLQSGI